MIRAQHWSWPLCAATLVLVVLICSALLWRSLYPLSDWALLAWAPLMFMLLLGQLSSSLALHQARMRAAVKPQSAILRLLSGRLKASLGALVFVSITLPLLAWQASTSGLSQAMAYAALCLCAVLVFVGLQRWLQQHFHQPYVRRAAISLGTWLVALPFIPIVAWVNMNLVQYPGAIRAADSLYDAMLVGMQALPLRRSWVAELMAPLYAYEAGKLWLVVQLSPSRWAAMLFSLDAALFCLVVARVSIILAAFVQTLTERIKS